MAEDTSRISPTAHYTGFVWFRNGMSHPALMTRQGRLMYHALRPATAGYHAAGGPSLEAMLLARHRVIDHLLDEAITSGEIGQVVEIAAGLSPRGHRFMERHRDRGLVYVEGDLPGMAGRKRAILDGAGLLGAGHHVVELDALADDGPRSLARVAGELLDPAVGTAIITEGLLNYFDADRVTGLWRRFAGVLRRFPRGRYLADLSLGDETRSRGTRAFIAALSAFARGQVHLHFATSDDAAAALDAAGFAQIRLHRAGDTAAVLGSGDLDAASGNMVRIVDVATR
jgi:O-methyltransferase involved in polyketide biosynthesis